MNKADNGRIMQRPISNSIAFQVHRINLHASGNQKCSIRVLFDEKACQMMQLRQNEYLFRFAVRCVLVLGCE